MYLRQTCFQFRVADAAKAPRRMFPRGILQADVTLLGGRFVLFGTLHESLLSRAKCSDGRVQHTTGVGYV